LQDLDVHETSEGRAGDKACYPLYSADPTTEPIFPPELMLAKPRPLLLKSAHVTWYRPVTLEALVALKARHPEAKLVMGNTEVGIETKFKNLKYPVIIAPSGVPEISAINVLDNGVEIGAAVTLARLEHFIGDDKGPIKASDPRARPLLAIRNMLRWFASNQIRNVASVAGNIATASPISDLNPVLCACDAVLTLVSQGQPLRTRRVRARDFFLSYRKVDLQPEEVIHSVMVPFASEWEFVGPFKQARRREDDISIVTGCIRVRLRPSQDGTGAWVVEEAGLGFGGMAPKTVTAPRTEAYLRGRPWSDETLEGAYACLSEDLPLPPNVPGGQCEFRRSLPPSFLFKFYIQTCLDLQELLLAPGASPNLPPPPQVAAVDRSAALTFVTQPKPRTRGEQRYQVLEDGAGLQTARPVPHARVGAEEQAKGRGPVGKPLMHKSALAQVTGEARYVDDIPPPPGCLYAALVMSTRAHARLLAVNPEPALQLDGVVRFLSHKDVTGCNKIGAVVKDEECFATEVVTHVGAVIGLIVAESETLAQEAAKLVQVEYEDLPAVTNIEEAILKDSFFDYLHHINDGDDVERLMFDPDNVVVEGEMRVGGQEHFYLETNCTMAVPGEDGSLELHASTQAPTKTQNFCASVCGVPANKVVCHMKRMGGGFGGKETRSVFISCAVALAAHTLERPVRINVERDVDMLITGQRHAFLARYRAAASRVDGKLRALEVDMYSNGGFSLDLSAAVTDRALFHVDNCYKWPALRCT
jgi:xanthine dehydrogenase/oxidase